MTVSIVTEEGDVTRVIDASAEIFADLAYREDRGRPWPTLGRCDADPLAELRDAGSVESARVALL
jgi:hypothetical protein